MKQTIFEETYSPEWVRFERWLDQRERLRRRRRAPPQDQALDAQEVPRVYRRVCQFLALARERQYSPDLVDRLNGLALRGHHLLYGARGGQAARVLSFLAAGFPRLVRSEWPLVAAGFALFFGPLLVFLAVAWMNGDFIHFLIDPRQLAQFQEMYDPHNPRLGMREADDNVMMFAFYIWNNVKIGLQTFATGIVFGLGTVFFLVMNGMTIGAVAGYLTGTGSGTPFWSFVAGHSAMELTAIVISGAAGMKLGMAVISPGGRTRKSALVKAGKPASQLMYGAALMFIIAAFIEGFWSPLTVFPFAAKIATGIALWLALLGYLAFGGRSSAN